jgi:uncharacterized protein
MDHMVSTSGLGPIPAAAGIGLRGPHHDHFLRGELSIPWVEAHSENYFADKSVAAHVLQQIRETYPVSLHGVGLSIGSVDPINQTHLESLRRLIDRLEPGLVSEHLCWGSVDGAYLNDLIPLPYTEEALDHMVDQVHQVQDYLGRQILIENVSSYLEFASSTIPEWEFLDHLARRSGCGILLDINNIYVSARNHGIVVNDYINGISPQFVAEMHLAGHSIHRYSDREVVIDTHDSPVCEEVWTLYASAVARFGVVPTLIEWDAQLPPVTVLAAEAARAQKIMDRAHDIAA